MAKKVKEVEVIETEEVEAEVIQDQETETKAEKKQSKKNKVAKKASSEKTNYGIVDGLKMVGSGIKHKVADAVEEAKAHPVKTGAKILGLVVATGAARAGIDYLRNENDSEGYEDHDGAIDVTLSESDATEQIGLGFESGTSETESVEVNNF